MVCGENLEEERLCGLKCLDMLGLGRNTDASCTDPCAKARKNKPTLVMLKCHRRP